MEKWKYVKGYEDKYSISSYGNLKRNYTKIINGKKIKSTQPIKIYTDKNRYLRCDLISYEGKRKSALIHRLVAQEFILNPNNYNEINHIDGNKSNNRIDNLEWCNRAYNMRHASNNNLLRPPSGNQHFRSKAVCQIDPNTNKVVKIWESVNMATRALGGRRSYGGSHIWDVIKGKRKTCFGYKWKLFDE